MDVEGKFGICCCTTPTPEGVLTREVAWPWPGWLPLNFDAENDIADTKYLRKIERIEITEVDYGAGYYCAQTPPTPDCPVEPFAAYSEREEWFTVGRHWLDSWPNYRERAGWVPDLLAIGREGAPEDDLSAESTIDECGVRTTWDIEDIMVAPDDFLWPYCALFCPGGTPSWGSHLYEQAIATWPSWIGALVSSTTNAGGTETVETYENGTRTITLSDPYTLAEAYTDAEDFLADFLFSAVPETYIGFDGEDFVWGTDTGAGQNPTLALAPGSVCDEGEVVQAFRLVPPFARSTVQRSHDTSTIYVKQAYLPSGDWCANPIDEYDLAVGAGALSYVATTSDDLVGPLEVGMGTFSLDYGFAAITSGTCS